MKKTIAFSAIALMGLSIASADAHRNESRLLVTIAEEARTYSDEISSESEEIYNGDSIKIDGSSANCDSDTALVYLYE